MKKLRKTAAGAALAACLLLSGCFFSGPEDLFHLPQAPAEYENLMAEIDRTRYALAEEYSTTVEDVPPSAGDNTSTVQTLDMDGDGTQETAVTFFRVVGAELPIRIYFYELQPDGSYQVANIVEGDGTAVYAIYYVDLDGYVDPETGKTRQEVVVSWQMSQDVYTLGAYSLSSYFATNMLMTAYQGYELVDLDRDGRMELAVCHLEPEPQIENSVEVYDWDEGEVVSVTKAALSSGITSLGRIRSNFLTGMIPALYISGTMADGSRVTDVVAMADGQNLTNLSLDPETGISRERVSVYQDVASQDVNGDYILELAHPRELPSYGGSGTFWLIDWSQYDPQGQEQAVCTTYHNVTDGWYLIIPEHWRDQITIYRNDSVSGQRAVIFALWQGEDREPLPFLSIYRLTGESRFTRATSSNRFILAEEANTIYAAAFYTSWDCGLDQNSLLENFRLIVTSWSGD